MDFPTRKRVSDSQIVAQNWIKIEYSREYDSTIKSLYWKVSFTTLLLNSSKLRCTLSHKIKIKYSGEYDSISKSLCGRVGFTSLLLNSSTLRRIYLKTLKLKNYSPPPLWIVKNYSYQNIPYFPGIGAEKIARIYKNVK